MNYHIYEQYQTIASKTVHAIFQGYLKYAFAKIGDILNNFKYFSQTFAVSGIEPAIL